MTGRSLARPASVVFTVLAALPFFLFGPQAEAANWGPRNGHPRITYEAATESEIPEPVARVMAFASVAPDYFEFTHPEAHAQRKDPPWKRQGGIVELCESKADCLAEYQEALQKSHDWQRFYFNAAVVVIQQGRREQAAFLLGYALHNTQDFPIHRLMPNILHAQLDHEGENPDDDPESVSEAQARSKEEMARFRKEIGESLWKVFTSSDPLPQLGEKLRGWNPSTHPIPPVKDRKDFYRSQTNGQVTETNKLRIEILRKALYPREKQMIQFLGGVERHSGDPAAPHARGLLGLFVLGIEGLEYQRLSHVYEKMPLEDRSAIRECWEQFNRENVGNRHACSLRIDFRRRMW